MIINKRRIGTVSESRKYIAVTGLLAGLFQSTADSGDILDCQPGDSLEYKRSEGD